MEEIINLFLAATFGAIFGSYATLFAYRLPLNESCFGRYFGQKSRCPVCSAIIKTRDLVPLFNWLFTLGTCRNCQSKIPRTHLFIELSTTTLFILSYLKFGFSEEFILYSLLFTGIVILLVCDYTHKIFPYQTLIYILIIGLLIKVLESGTILPLVFSASFGVVFSAIFYQVFHKEAAFFSSQEQAFDYVKFILIASVLLQLPQFLSYFLVIMIIFTSLLIFNLPKNKNMSLGYIFIIPFLWLIIS